MYKQKCVVQNLEWSNVERPIFRNLKITNIKIAKHELVDYFIYDFFLLLFQKLLEPSKYLIIYSKFHNFSKLLNFGNFIILKVKN